jgi:nitrogen fixation NifU-like protein
MGNRSVCHSFSLAVIVCRRSITQWLPVRSLRMASSPEEFVLGEMRAVYNETVVDHTLRPRNLGEMENASGFGKITGPCGDTMAIWLRVEANVVVAATFASDGCGATLACGSMLTEMVRGKSIPQALGISQSDALDALGGLPEGNEHCALLAVDTLRAAIKDYLAFKKEPWKRAYRTYSGGG